MGVGATPTAPPTTPPTGEAVDEAVADMVRVAAEVDVRPPPAAGVWKGVNEDVATGAVSYTHL